jgi:hypothetical protein
VPVFLSQPWLMALIPVGLAIMPINKLTILLLLVLAADVAVALLLAQDLRQYRLHTVSAQFGSYSHRLRCWTARAALSNEMAINLAQIEELDNETMNANQRSASGLWRRRRDPDSAANHGVSPNGEVNHVRGPDPVSRLLSDLLKSTSHRAC